MKLDLLILLAFVAIGIADWLSQRQKDKEDAAWGRERNNLGRVK